MVSLWKENPKISFAFFAVPRVGENALRKNRRARFNIYQTAMQNLFSPKDFRQYMDPNSFVYVLLNVALPNKREVIQKIGKYLLKEYEMIFEPYMHTQAKIKRLPREGLRMG